MLVTLHQDWISGRNRFERPGEALFQVRGPVGLAGLCGLNRDPYSPDEGVGRLRRLYVAPAERRAGVGEALVRHALAHARGSFTLVRLRTSNPEAARFFRALGFSPTPEDPFATHAIRAPFEDPAPRSRVHDCLREDR